MPPGGRRRLPGAGTVEWLALLPLASLAGASNLYSLVTPGNDCADYGIPDVATEADCFSVAAAAVGLSGKTTFRLDGAGFTGCLYNVDADLLMFGTSSQNVKINSWRYVCNGEFTTTITTTVSTSTLTTTTFTDTTITVQTGQGYSVIDFFETCSMYKIEDITSADECFSEAAPYVGLGAITTLPLNGMGFTGCVHNLAAGLVLYGNTSGVQGQTSGYFKYICRGIATTTTTTTETSTTTVTSTTATSSTSTVTTMTTSTSTVTTSTSTFTSTTATSSTSTRSTMTMTGSSSSRTTSTTSTFTTATYTTVTSSTSTYTTMTTTYTPWWMAKFVGDDPLTYYGGVAQKFYLPDGALIELFATSEFRVRGAAFNLGPDQWIKRLVLESLEGEAVASVAIRSDLEGLKQGEVPDDHFSTLNISLDWLGLPLKAIPTPDSYAYAWNNVVFAFMRVPDFYIGEAQVEMMVIDGWSARVVIMAVAGPVEEGEDESLAARYAHLDFVMHLKQQDETCEGILPEIWGLRPFSNTTLAMLEAPTG